MFKNLAVLLIGLSMCNSTFSMDDLDNSLEKREINYKTNSIEAIVPKDFRIDQEILEESMQHAVEYQQDQQQILKDVIAYALDTEFWNAIREKDVTKSILYMFSAIKNGTPALVESFRYALTDIDPRILKEINGHSIRDGDTRQKLENVAKILVSH